MVGEDPRIVSDSALCASHGGLPSVSVCMRLRA
jgi:hypothetical protein